MKISNFKRIWIAASALLLLASCTKEVEVGGGGTAITNEGSVSVMLSLGIPGTQASSRALTPAQEDAVKTVDVFVFDKDDKLVDWKYGTMNSSGDGFTALIGSSKNNTDTYRLMVLANARHITYPRFKGTPNSVDRPGGDNLGGYKDKSYAEVYADLTCDIEQTPTVSTTDVYADKGIPMWGMMKDAAVVNESNNSFSMDMLRSVAMIDVGANPIPDTDSDGSSIWAPLSNFSLEKVRLYNSNKEYSVIPAAGKYHYADKKVTGLSLPAGVGKHTAPIEYSDDKQAGTVTRDGDDKGYAVASAIYAAETDVKMGGTYGDNKHPDRTALVVAGYYSPDPASPNTTDLSYYRVDFAPGGTLTDLLRNHTYQITISNVSGSGSPSPEEAMKKIDANITAVIKTWANAYQAATVVDGQNWLSIDRHDIVTDKWVKIDKLTITTNVSAGWSAAVTEGGSWLSLTDGATVTGSSGDELKFNIAQIPSPTSERTGKIKITAGNMSLSVVIKQTDEDSDFMLALSHGEMLFAGRQWDAANSVWTAPDPQILTVDWAPRLNEYGMSLASYVGGGVTGFLPPSTSNDPSVNIGLDMIDPNGSRVQDDPFYERSSLLAVTAWDIAGTETITKQVLIRQVFYSLGVTGSEDYYFQNKTYTFNVKSNSVWVAEVSDANIFASDPSTSGTGNTSAGENFTFKISPTAAPNATATVTFRSPGDLFPPQTFTIVAQDEQPNSYFLAPNTGQITIPVSKAYRVWKYDCDLKDLNTDGDLPSGGEGAKLLWQDAPGLIGSVAFSPAPDPGQITVTAGTGTGNAVVAFTIDDEIYWSWHIWVTDEGSITDLPLNGTRIMDRYLGAMDATPGSTGTIGLTYQGGRKDPFPFTASFTSATNKVIYDESGLSLAWDSPGSGGIYLDNSPAQDGLHLAINNPTVFYKGTYGTQDWYGQLVENRPGLWNPVIKSDYDPCPNGWRIASQSSYDGITVQSFSNWGYLWNGVYFPAQGYISSTDAGKSGYGSTSLFWCVRSKNHSTAPNTPYAWGFTKTGSTSMSFTVAGAPVRCIRDQ